jgi:hypothetical protein
MESSRQKNKSKQSKYDDDLITAGQEKINNSEPGISQQSKTVGDTRAEVALRQEIDDFDGFNNSSDEEGVESIESEEPKKLMENIEEEEDEEDNQKFKEAYNNKKREGQKIQKDFDLGLRTAKGKNIGLSFEEYQKIEDEKEDPLVSLEPPEDAQYAIFMGENSDEEMPSVTPIVDREPTVIQEATVESNGRSEVQTPPETRMPSLAIEPVTRTLSPDIMAR